MPVTKKKCVNDDQFTYTGKEVSPLGLGHTASKYVVGDRMKGRDDTMWMVAKKNDVNVWVRVPSETLTKDTPVIPPGHVDANPEENDDEPEDKEPEPEPAPPPKVSGKPKKPQKKVTIQEPIPEEEEPKAKAKPPKAANAAGEPKTKKVSEYNLFVKLQTELAKVDPATKDMDGKARFRYVSQRASELWKTMDAAAKTAAVANMKVA